MLGAGESYQTIMLQRTRPVLFIIARKLESFSGDFHSLLVSATAHEDTPPRVVVDDDD